MRAIGSSLVCLFLLAAGARAADFGWRDEQGRPLQDSESRKSSRSFGGQVMLTDDADWREKWESPETPRYSTTDEVTVGQTIVALIFFVNAAVDASGNVRVMCDVRVKRPDGSISTDQKALVCAEGAMQGDKYSLRLAAVTPGFLGEASDIPGKWIIEVVLTDAVRNVTLPLAATFEFRKP